MAQIVLVKIAAMFLVIVIGWVARQRGYLAGEFTVTLSRLVGYLIATMPVAISCSVGSAGTPRSARRESSTALCSAC